MKEKIATFINGLITYDYILFGAVFALFIVFIIFALVVRKRLGLSIFLVLFSFSILFIAPPIGYIEMHKYLFKNSTNLISQKKLLFTPAIVVKGSISNESKRDFQDCKIDIDIHKVGKNILKEYLYKFKLLATTTFIETDIKKGDTRYFKVIVEPFNYSKEYNITLGAKCR